MIPHEKSKSLAPALDAGLDIMEFLSMRKEAGFNELCKLLPMSKASVSRVLKTLAERGYAKKDDLSGKWLPGPRMGMAGMAIPVSEILRREAPGILKSFTDTTGSTALCIYWSGEEFQVLAKEQREGGIVMMEVGTVVRDLSKYPWGWLFYLSLDDDGRQRIAKYFQDPEWVRRRLPVWQAYIEAKGFALDDHEIYENRMRFGAPILDGHGRVVGAVGTSPTRSVPPDQMDWFGSELLRHAAMFSAKLIDSNTNQR